MFVVHNSRGHSALNPHVHAHSTKNPSPHRRQKSEKIDEDLSKMSGGAVGGDQASKRKSLFSQRTNSYYQQQQKQLFNSIRAESQESLVEESANRGPEGVLLLIYQKVELAIAYVFSANWLSTPPSVDKIAPRWLHVLLPPDHGRSASADRGTDKKDADKDSPRVADLTQQLHQMEKKFLDMFSSAEVQARERQQKLLETLGHTDSRASMMGDVMQQALAQAHEKAAQKAEMKAVVHAQVEAIEERLVRHIDKAIERGIEQRMQDLHT